MSGSVWRRKDGGGRRGELGLPGEVSSVPSRTSNPFDLVPVARPTVPLCRPMDVPPSKLAGRPSETCEPSGSFLATVRHRLGGSSFALPSLLDGHPLDPDPDHDQHHPALQKTRNVEGGNGQNDEHEEDLEELMWDAQVSTLLSSAH